MAQFMVVLDFSIVNVALPSIGTGLHVSTSTLQWLVSAYAISFGGFLLGGSPGATRGTVAVVTAASTHGTLSAWRPVWSRGRR